MHPMLNVAVKAARRAGRIITRASIDLDTVKVSRKQQNDFVTEVDRASGDPLVNDDHLRLLNVATPAVLREMRELGHKINAVLLPFFRERRMMLVDFKLEFGVFHNRLILADEISPDTCRFWDQTTKESMDKDRFRKDLGKIEEAYQEVLKRVCE